MRQENRRTVLKGIGSMLLASYAGPSLPQNDLAAQPTAPATHTAETWMAAWMGPMRIPVGALYVGRFSDPVYFLAQPITWRPNKGQEQYKEVTVPKGFVTDFASIPQVFWSLLRPDGKYAYAAVVHDYLYWFQERSRTESDMIFKLGMEDFSIDSKTVKTIYKAVRAAGKSAWNQNARLKQAGEKRILTRFPEDPRISWQDWKKVSDNFSAT